MILTIAKKHEFIPKFNGNDKAPAAEQIKFVHRMPTPAMKERLFPRVYQFGADGHVSGSFEVDRRKVLSEMTTDIINLSYKLDEDKEATKIKSIDDLFSAPCAVDALIDEVYAYYNELLNEKVDEKN